MSEKKPDTPVVHLPWSHWEALTARLDALEAAVFKLGHHALHGLQQRDRPELSVLLAKVNGYVPPAAPPPPAAAPAPDVIERVRALLDNIARQMTSDELECACHHHGSPDYEGAYDVIVTQAREALRLLGNAP